MLLPWCGRTEILATPFSSRGRNIDEENSWALQYVAPLDSANGFFLVPDCRFPFSVRACPPGQRSVVCSLSPSRVGAREYRRTGSWMAVPVPEQRRDDRRSGSREMDSKVSLSDSFHHAIVRWTKDLG